MESEILAGRAIQHREQVLKVDPDELDPDIADRVEAVTDGVMHLAFAGKQRVCVLDSGIDPELNFGPDEENLAALDAEVVEDIGLLPELPAPSSDVEAVVQAWEAWLSDYRTAALKTIERLNTEPPPVLVETSAFSVEEREWKWGSVGISFGDGLDHQITLEDGAKAIRDARSGFLWRWAASRNFSSESYAAAKEATDARPSEGRAWLSEMSAEALAERFVRQRKQLYLTAKAHHSARRAKVPDFEVEMKRWADQRGSDRLRLGIEDGYRMNSRYLAERIAAEAPGMYAMSAKSAKDDWASKAGSPSEAALRLRRRVAAAIEQNAPRNLGGMPETEILNIKKPPHEIFKADPGIETEDGRIGTDLPSRMGWPWGLDSYGEPTGFGAKPFEAVVVMHWLGRFHLVGAVADEVKGSPPGIWAVPDPDHYDDDGTVTAQDPDASAPKAAKRKPPETEKNDDIPF